MQRVGSMQDPRSALQAVSPLRVRPTRQRGQGCLKARQVHYRHGERAARVTRAADSRDLLQAQQKDKAPNAPDQRHRTHQASHSFCNPETNRGKKQGRLLIGDGYKILQTFIMSNIFLNTTEQLHFPDTKNYSFPAGKAVPHNRQQDTCHPEIPLWRLRSI